MMMMNQDHYMTEVALYVLNVHTNRYVRIILGQSVFKIRASAANLTRHPAICITTYEYV